MKKKIQGDLASGLKILDEVYGQHDVFCYWFYVNKKLVLNVYVGSNKQYVVGVKINL